MSQPARCLVTGSAGAAGGGVSLPRAATFAGDRDSTTGGATAGGAGGGTAAATDCVTGAGSLRIVVIEGFAGDGHTAARGEAGAAAVLVGAATGAAGARADGGSLLTVEMVVTLAGLETTGAGTSWRLSEGRGVSEAVYIVAGWTITVLSPRVRRAFSPVVVTGGR